MLAHWQDVLQGLLSGRHEAAADGCAAKPMEAAVDGSTQGAATYGSEYNAKHGMRLALEALKELRALFVPLRLLARSNVRQPVWACS
jgi:hypothetical protein